LFSDCFNSNKANNKKKNPKSLLQNPSKQAGFTPQKTLLPAQYPTPAFPHKPPKKARKQTKNNQNTHLTKQTKQTDIYNKTSNSI
jgi:hypothetical protein